MGTNRRETCCQEIKDVIEETNNTRFGALVKNVSTIRVVMAN